MFFSGQYNGLAALRLSYFQGWENQGVSLSGLDRLTENTVHHQENLPKNYINLVLVDPKLIRKAAMSPALKWRALPKPSICSHLPHGLQLLLPALIGSLQLLHLPLQLLLLSQQLLPQFFPTLAGFFVWWGTAQSQKMDSRMNGYKRYRRKNGKYSLSFVSLTCK